jgi:hypothetical protein
VGEDQHLFSRQPRQVREDHRLAGARRQAHDHALGARAPGGQDRIDGLALIRPEFGGTAHTATLARATDVGNRARRNSRPIAPRVRLLRVLFVPGIFELLARQLFLRDVVARRTALGLLRHQVSHLRSGLRFRDLA